MTEPLRQALDAIFDRQEPYPALAMNPEYDVLLANRAGARMLSQYSDRPVEEINAIEMLFTATHPVLDDWEVTARELWRRLHRESLRSPKNTKLLGLLELMSTSPLVESHWLEAALHLNSEPVATITFRLPNDDRLAFLSTITTFNAPQNVALEELRVECFYPLDSSSAEACERHLGGSAPRHLGALRS